MREEIGEWRKKKNKKRKEKRGRRRIWSDEIKKERKKLREEIGE